ncbi:hypothetical protein F3Y22_tig00110896pilonHSYRG00049 [Hibiscus syriacus]|uniref:Reverse transcriptase Ty1/copia-type domain-containing protein n=1 Tax=Hibiscus syriacus TaxID=106335 RepID=A0A6A2ZFF6_HIBSY|nr:hypothetical protein F3Y22_tig00110896pilonHSYRG00049 [Hibiscus syriacus]
MRESLRGESQTHEESINMHEEPNVHMGNNLDLQGSNSGYIDQHSRQPNNEVEHYNEAVPTSVQEAMQSSEWKNAVHAEIDALQKNETWSLVKLPPGRMVIGCKWLFKLKCNPDGSIHRYKARLVKGFTQVPGHDLCDTFSPVVKFTTVNAILSMAVSNTWELRLIDINNALLNGDLKEDAPRNWHSSLFFKGSSSDRVYLLVYVDDILITGGSSHGIKAVVDMLQGKFSLKDLGALSYFLALKCILGCNLDDRRSVSGYGVFIGKFLVAWSSKKQRSVSRNTMEAEYKSVVDTAVEVTWISTLLNDLGIQQQGKSVIWCDNTSAVAMSANPIYHAQSKHVELDVHFVREKVAAGHICFNYVPVAHQVANGFIKPLSQEAFEEFRDKVKRKGADASQYAQNLEENLWNLLGLVVVGSSPHQQKINLHVIEHVKLKLAFQVQVALHLWPMLQYQKLPPCIGIRF